MVAVTVWSWLRTPAMARSARFRRRCSSQSSPISSSANAPAAASRSQTELGDSETTSPAQVGVRVGSGSPGSRLQARRSKIHPVKDVVEDGGGYPDSLLFPDALPRHQARPRGISDLRPGARLGLDPLAVQYRADRSAGVVRGFCSSLPLAGGPDETGI